MNFWRTMLRLGAEGSDRTPEDKKGAKIIVAIGLCILAVGLALHVVHNLNSYLVAAVGILFVLIGIYTYF